MTFAEWERDLGLLVEEEMGVQLSETGYDRPSARRAFKQGDRPRQFMEASVASPDAVDPIDLVELGLG